jgi:fatty acid/phospholipid biosynthesis enzyme
MADRMEKCNLFNQSVYDGAPIFGIKYPVIKAHGNAMAKTIKNVARQAKYLLESDFISEVERQLNVNKQIYK